MEGVGATELILGGGVILWLTREVWWSLLRRKGDVAEAGANAVLLEGLRKRIESLEVSLVQVHALLEEETKARRLAEERAHRQQLRIQTLESALRRLGAVIPEEE